MNFLALVLNLLRNLRCPYTAYLLTYLHKLYIKSFLYNLAAKIEL